MQDRLDERAEPVTRACSQGLGRRLAEQMEGSPLAQHLRVRLARRIAPETERRHGAAESEVAQDDLRQPRREHWVDDEQAEHAYRLQAEQRVQEQRESALVPRLDRVRTWVRARVRELM